MEIKKSSFINDKLITYLICLFGVFPILPKHLKGLPVVVFFIGALYFFLKKEKIKFNFKGFFKLSSLFFVIFLSIFYTGSFYFPLDKIETSLSLFIIPLSFHLIRSNIIKSNHNRLFIKCFILSTTILSIASIYYYYFNNLFKKDYFKVNSFRKLILEIPIVNDHPIYISLYLAITILFSIAIFSNSNKKVLLVGINLINLFHLFLLSSKGIIIAVLISAVLLLILKLKNRWTKVIFVSCIFGLFIASLIYFPNMRRRFKELGIKTTYTELQITNSTSLRITIYKCAIEKIKKKPILGYGWGNGDAALSQCYKEKSEYLYKEKLNSHNQYLDYYLKGGIIALLVLMYFLYQQLIISIKEKKYLFTSIIILFAIQMLSENILNRQSGIIMFIFIISLFSAEKRSYG